MKKRLAAIFILALTLSLIPAFAFGEDGSVSADSSITAAEETAVTEGWVEKNGKTYYYINGKKATGWQTIDGEKYHFSKYGVMHVGMKKIDGKVYYLNKGVKKGTKKGAMTVKDGWCWVGGSKYYGKPDGTFVTKPKKIGKYVYMFAKNGKLKTTKGLFKYNGKYYYGLGNGKLKTGWVAKGKKAMYFNKKTCKTGTIGSMARNTTVGYLKIPKSGKLGEAYALGVKQLDKSGWSLMNAYTFSYRLRYGDRWYRRKTSEEYALRGFKYGYGNCYVMAATFYIQAKLLGYDVHQVAGKVDLPHSWTVIYEDGKQWVYDPNFRNETGRNGYKIYYGKKGTWRYNSYYQMN